MSELIPNYKTYKTIDEQIEYLKENKKIIVPSKYKYVLMEQNYISLINAYKEFFACGLSGPNNEHVYKKETHITDILKIFQLDKNIEQVLYELIGDFERHFKNILIQEICSKYAECLDEELKDIACVSYIHEIESFYKELAKFESIKDLYKKIRAEEIDLEDLKVPRFCKNIFYEIRKTKYVLNELSFKTGLSLVEKIYFYGGGNNPNIQNPNQYEPHNTLIKHYIKTQGYAPMWTLPNILTFGELHILYSMLDSFSQERILAHLMYTNVDRIRTKEISAFSSHLETIRNIRNIVNHYEPIIPYFTTNITNKKIEDSQIIKALKLLMINHFKNSDALLTVLYPMPITYENGYNNRKIKIINTVYSTLKQ